jgi:hypothetical protein
MTEISDDQLRSFLKDEYAILQRLYEDFDQRSLTIKGWISFASVAAIALGLDTSKNPRGEIWLIVAIICCCIWYLEGRWKTFQYAFRNRIRTIEAFFRNDPDLLEKSIVPFQIYEAWFDGYNDRPIFTGEARRRGKPLSSRLATAMFQDFVFLPYLPIIGICGYLYLRQFSVP